MSLKSFSSAARWDEWVNHHFGAAGINISFYADNDNDGLVNVLEYYADEIANDDRGLTRDTLERISIDQLGLDPNQADSDGDLLTDGFEWFYGFNPKVQVRSLYFIPWVRSLEKILYFHNNLNWPSQDDIRADPDGDSLDNIREQEGNSIEFQQIVQRDVQQSV